MASTSIKHLGPYDIKDLSLEMVTDVCVNKGMPMVVRETVGDDEIKYAVVAKDKSLSVVCAGCFKEGMTLQDNSRCRVTSSHVKHWDKFQGGERKRKCNGVQDIQEVAESCPPDMFVTNFDGEVRCDDVGEFKACTDEEVCNEVEQRGLGKDVVRMIDDDTLMMEMTARGIRPLYGSRQTHLIHELRRQKRGVSVEDYYVKEKGGGPHSEDRVGVELLEVTDGRETRRSSKRAKVVKTLCEPRTVGDYRV